MTTLWSGFEAKARRSMLTAVSGCGVDGLASAAHGPTKSTTFVSVPLFGNDVPIGVPGSPQYWAMAAAHFQESVATDGRSSLVLTVIAMTSASPRCCKANADEMAATSSALLKM